MSPRVLHYSDLETALDDPRRCARLAGTIAARRDDGAIVVGSGDNTAPGALSIATEGRVAMDFFGAVEPDAETFGNHDFDFGHEVARDLAAAAPQPWLCANAHRNGGRFAPDATAPGTLAEADGATVGVVGVAHPDTASINPGADGVAFTDPVPAVREEAAALRDRGADYVVVTSHCGRADERIARETDVDAVLGGHVHDVVAETIAGTAVVRPGRAGEYLSEVRLGPTPEATVHEVADGHVDDALAAALRDRMATHGLDRVVATVDEPIERTEKTVTTAESRVGNLVTDALRWKTGADVAISPPGGPRAGDPLAGEVTVADLVGLIPYEDDLALGELPGDRLREALADLPFGYHHEEYPDRHCSHVSGARVTWDDDAGSLVAATVGGEPIDPDRTYTVATSEYVVETDHVVDAVDAATVVDEFGLARDAIVEYAREADLDPTIEGRIERPALGEPRTDDRR